MDLFPSTTESDWGQEIKGLEILRRTIHGSAICGTGMHCRKSGFAPWAEPSSFVPWFSSSLQTCNNTQHSADTHTQCQKVWTRSSAQHTRLHGREHCHMHAGQALTVLGSIFTTVHSKSRRKVKGKWWPPGGNGGNRLPFNTSLSVLTACQDKITTLACGGGLKKKKNSAAGQLCSHTLNYFITFPVQTPTANATCPSSSSAGGSRHRCQASYLGRLYRTPASHQPFQWPRYQRSS